MKIIYFTMQAAFIALMIGVAGIFLLPLLPIDNNVQLRIVESGSMEPHIMTGSLVLIIPATDYKIGDVVTFTSKTANVPTTHRIIDSYNESGALFFTTKGDANEDADSAPANAKDVLGRVFLAVPYAGYILDFARQPIGFSLLIVLPALMIIFGEIEKIWAELKVRRRDIVSGDSEEDDDMDNGGVVLSDLKSTRMMDVGTPAKLRELPTLNLRHKKALEEKPSVIINNHYNTGQWATLCVAFLGSIIFVSAGFLPYTASYFNDIERSLSNVMQAGMLDFKASTDGDSYNFIGATLDNASSSIVNIVEPESGSVDVKYDISVEFTGGDATFCGNIIAETNSPFIYNGPITSLTADDILLSNPLALQISLASSSLFTSGEVCQIDIVYTAWNSAVNNGEGYFDEERIPMSFNAPLIIEQLNTLFVAPLLLDTKITDVVEEDAKDDGANEENTEEGIGETKDEEGDIENDDSENENKVEEDKSGEVELNEPAEVKEELETEQETQPDTEEVAVVEIEEVNE